MPTKKDLLSMCKVLGIEMPGLQTKTKEFLSDLIKNKNTENQDASVLKTGNITRYIYHTADIHIRTLDRHHEYSVVFDNLYKILQNQNKEHLEQSVFVIAGDIFHNRDKLAPETLVIFNNLVKNLCSLIDVIVILGNHDTFINNNRMDIMSGILSLKQEHNFFLLKESGCYTYNNISFCVSSLYDKKFINCPKKVDGITYISLYHGPVVGSKLDNGTEIPFSNKYPELSFFNNFDYIMLGDIHKRQFLKENCAYPGSLIQQNHGEEPIHGILKWDLQNKTNEFIKVLNNHAFLTMVLRDNEIYVINGENPVLLLELEPLPEFVYVRLLHSYLEEIDTETIKERINKISTIKSFSKEIYDKDERFLEPDDNVLNNSSDGTGITSIDSVAMNIFEKYIADYPEYSNELLNLHNDYLKEMTPKNVCTSDGKWIIKNIEFSNVFIYGNSHKNVIDFQKGITGIIGNNAIGKSCIFNIIIYMLFGNISKTKNLQNRNIINRNSNNYYIKMTVYFPEKETSYLIERSGRPKKRDTKGYSMEENLSLFKILNETSKDITETTKSDTTQKLHSILNLVNKQSFIFTNVLSYTNYMSMIDMSGGEISTRFAELFDLEKYSLIYSSSLKEYKRIANDLLVQTELVGTINYIEEDEVSTESEVLLLKEKVIHQENTVKELSIEIENIIQKEIKIGTITKVSKEGTIEELEKLKESYSVIEKPRKKSVLQYRKTFLENELGLLYDVTPKETKKSREELEAEKLELEKSIIPVKKMVTEKEKEAITAKGQFCVDFLIEDLTNEASLSKDNVNLPLDLYNDIKEFLISVNSKEYLQDSIKMMDYQDLQKNKELMVSINKKKSRIKFLITEELEQIDKELVTHVELEKLELEIEKISAFIKYRETLEQKETLIKEKASLNSKSKEILTDLTKNKKDISLLEFSITQNKSNKEKSTRIKEKIVTLRKKETLYKIYKDILNEKKLPKMLLSGTVKKIELEANKLIYKLCNIYISLVSLDTMNWELLIKKDNIFIGVEHASGFEKFIINVCLKVILDKYKFYEKSGIFIIDECFDCISEENISKVSDVFELLKKEYYTTLVISHNDALKNKLDNRINIHNEFSVSKII